MKFLIISHVEHKLIGNRISAYAPYVREMNIWFKHVDEVTVLAPLGTEQISAIDLEYKHQNLSFNAIPSIQFTGFKHALKSIIKIPRIFIVIFSACRKTDHIHLRCPGNIGLIGCLVQVFFPKKMKTAKYAGNWDPNATQPLSYKFQKWMLSNTFLTRNMTALVYGDWKNQTKNVKSFFTATYRDADRQVPTLRSYTGALKFVYVGSLVEGKRPLLAIQIVTKLKNKGFDVMLDLFGDGVLKSNLQNYISKNNLNSFIKLKGNQEKEVVKAALKEADFLILLSKSEGWPKAIAEGMFFGVVPIATSVSCIPNMLGYGSRGIIVDPDIDNAVETIQGFLNNTERLKLISVEASKWSQSYTLDVFENELIKLLKA